SNQALCALTAAVYMSTMGPKGLQQAASQSMSKAHYFAQLLSEIPGVTVQNSGAWFHEFMTMLPVPAESVLDALAAADILGGLPVADGILWCVTEVVTKEQLDKAAAIIKEVCTA
ncbi:MAG: aminomethyl-transferring glycine dehydrogenase, partial [Peptococcaceae bacterium]|nr:aminomethyl-transferring glycine dehydrogenase [Peptococcaceae bacterium]